MNEISVFVCHGCLAPRGVQAAHLRDALEAQGVPALVTEAECMSGCARPQTIAFRARNKTAYLFGDIGKADLPDILRFANLYATSTDGNFADARPLGDLRFKAIARIPA